MFSNTDRGIPRMEHCMVTLSRLFALSILGSWVWPFVSRDVIDHVTIW